MIRQMVFGLKIEKTSAELTAQAGLALLADYNHGLGLRELADQHLPGPGSNRGYKPSALVDSLILMLQGRGRRLMDVRELRQEKPLLKLVDRGNIPDPDTIGDWLRRWGDPKNNHAGLFGLEQVRDTVHQRILRRDTRSDYTLDMDAMQVEAEKQALDLPTRATKDRCRCWATCSSPPSACWVNFGKATNHRTPVM